VGAVAVLAAVGAAGCGADETTAEPTATTAESPATSAESPAASDSGPVTQQQAEEAALAAVGEGEVTWSGPEDDRGAAWEVEVTRADGSEVDVLVAADGSIVKQVDKYTGPADAGAAAAPAGGGQITLQDAEQIALEAVGEGQVTWSGEEDERGAAFEIEVTRDNGTEIDVLVDAEGNIVP
ncbi:MAG TPA: PepSY domain-containing protein, partial [Dermatophilaceae bacterium]|nr:PepSY domain-containing protein [Dermatophilaceae bacterium]